MRQAHSSNTYLAIAKETLFGGNIQEKTKITCVADVAGSLNNKFFYISSPTVNYYFWFNINSGGSDPTPDVTRTAEVVAAATGATAAAIATALAAKFNTLTGIFTAVAMDAVVTVTATVAGYYASDPVDAGFTGFRVEVATPWTFLEFESEDIKNDLKKIMSEAKVNSRYPHDAYPDVYDVGGSINNIEVSPDNAPLLLGCATGPEAAPTGANPYTHVFTPATIDPLVSLAVQKRMDVTSMRALGMRVIENTWSCVLHSILKMTSKMAGQSADETIGGKIAEKTTILCVADVAKSLAGRYIFLNTPTRNLVFWFEVSGTGVDPALPERESYAVYIQTNDTAADVAAALRYTIDSALGETAPVFYTAISTATVTLICAKIGAVEAPSDAGNTGFTITRVVAGSDVDPNGDGLYSSRLPFMFKQGQVKIATTGGGPAAVYFVESLERTMSNGTDVEQYRMDGSGQRYDIQHGEVSEKLKIGCALTAKSMGMRTVHLANTNFSASLLFTSSETISNSNPATKYQLLIEWPHLKTLTADPVVGTKGPLKFDIEAEVIAPPQITIIDGRSTKWTA